ncbi:ChbG/HpnK family deacetylase [candidate division KSB1 bacterium]|nr:ChbG/HpnK family deacetylase [candidate division KSB1 bacterium]
MNVRALCVAAVLAWVGIGYAPIQAAEPTQLLIRCDDIGMCHAVNMACKELIEIGLPFSASVMFTCPWYQEAVELLKDHPQVSIGVHLTLNAEWENYRWGPIVGREAVPTLVDSLGFFFPSRAAFFANQPEISEIEKELRAQIERALSSGLQIDYLDHHMSTAAATPELRKLLEKLAAEYRLGISRYFSEKNTQGIYAVAIDAKADSLTAAIQKLEPGNLHLLVFHIGRNDPEMQALVDMNSFGLQNMSQHRHAELNALCSPSFRSSLEENSIRLTTYRQLIADKKLDSMRRPVPEE